MAARVSGAPTNLPACLRAPEIVDLVTLGAVAHAELDTEIDTDADEQDGEIDRDQVERAHHHQAERRGQGEADEEIDEHGEDQTPGVQRPPQDEEDDGERDDAVAQRVFLDGGELLVRYRHRPGQSHARLEARADVGGGLTDGRACDMAGLDRAVVQYRAHLDEPAQLARRRWVALDEHAP